LQGPRIVQVNYHEFLAALRRAGDVGARIDPTERQRWSDWVRANDVKEAAFRTVGSNQFEGLVPVIIDDGSDWTGYFLYSRRDEACLRWVPSGPPKSAN
jgi:hypothetical protein